MPCLLPLITINQIRIWNSVSLEKNRDNKKVLWAITGGFLFVSGIISWELISTTQMSLVADADLKVFRIDADDQELQLGELEKK